MKVILQFDLPEEEDWFRDAQNGTKYLTAIQELDGVFRKAAKYDNQEWAQLAREALHKILGEQEINIWLW